MTERRTLAYAGALATGVLGLVPLAGLGLARLGVALTPALLGVLAVVGGGYGLATLRLDDARRGLVVAVVVLATVGANVPLGPIPAGVTVGPNLLLVDLPLLALAAVTLRTWRREHLTVAGALLVAYVVWSLLLVGLAPGPRPDVSLWYALHVARYALAFALVTRAVVDGWVAPRGALGAFLVAVGGHALVASVQAALGTVDGLTVLGMNTQVVDTLPLGPLGTLPTGPYVGGFTGGSPFATHLVLTLPIAAVALVRGRDDGGPVPRIVALVGLVWLATLVQLTAWDAARGATLVSLGLAGLLLGWRSTGVLAARGRRLGAVVERSAVGRRWRTGLAGALAAAVLWQVGRPGAGLGPTYLDPDLGQGLARSLDVPGFSTRNLGVRLYQYVGGTDTFLQYPLTGLGGGNYSYVATSYGPRANMIHNLFVGVLAETGLVGGVLLFGALAAAIRAVWLAAVDEDDPLWLGVLAGLGGVLALQCFQPQYLRSPSTTAVWIVLGLACGRVAGRRDRDPDDAWAAAWAGSTLVAGVATSRVTRALAALPDRLAALVGGSRLVGTATERAPAAVRASALVDGVRAATGESASARLWRRLRRYCADSRLFG